MVGTVSIEKSELLSDFLTREGVEHNVLNARFHEQEAHIVAQAGRLGAVTIATNMAGRGTDIKLGRTSFVELLKHWKAHDLAPKKIMDTDPKLDEAVGAAGGLFVLGTERHESRRIDNQLRGRSGRQGDPGLSRFYLSLEDDLLRIFGQQTMLNRMMQSGLEDGEAIVHPWISKAIETAQKKVEARNYDVRKQAVALVRLHDVPYRWHKAFAQGETIPDGSFRRLALQVEPDLLYRVARADCLGRTGDFKPEFEEWFFARVCELGIEQQAPAALLLGRHVLALGLPPGPRIGEITRAVYERQLDGEVATLDAAIAAARQMLE